MITYLIMAVTISCILLIVYHHLFYPLLLKWLAKRMPPPPVKKNRRSYKVSEGDQLLPWVTVLVPAYNEQNWIAAKIRNLASLDYPRTKLNVVVICDGCTDDTAAVAREAIQEAICSDVRFEIIEYRENRGKLAVINDTVPKLKCDILALTDVSALISVDSLLIAAELFQLPDTGVVNSSYRLSGTQNSGEAKYWQYQNNIKLGEACLGASLGAHGAFYLIRRNLFKPLQPDTINDDFILPMEIVRQGYKIAYDTNLIALEQESTSPNDDFKRRIRISAGNMQQAVRLFSLFSPLRPAIAFTFFSGKGLRLLTPYLLLFSLSGCLYLIEYPLFGLALAGQLLLLAAAAIVTLFHSRFSSRISHALRYLFSGHLANFIGGIRYLSGTMDRTWKKVNQ